MSNEYMRKYVQAELIALHEMTKNEKQFTAINVLLEAAILFSTSKRNLSENVPPS